MQQRPSKKQKELLSFIDGFIKGYGYGPSYREIMRALDYKSVSTVAVHVDGLIAKGFLVKKDNSARSLEVVATHQEKAGSSPASAHERWLQKHINTRIEVLKSHDTPQLQQELAILQEAANILNVARADDSKV